MSDMTYRQVLADGLWRNNTGLVQLLGLCPLLATSNSIINALGLGLATTAVLIASNGTISAIRHIVPKEIRLPVFVLVIAAFVTVQLVAAVLATGFFHWFLRDTPEAA